MSVRFKQHIVQIQSVCRVMVLQRSAYGFVAVALVVHNTQKQRDIIWKMMYQMK